MAAPDERQKDNTAGIPLPRCGHGIPPLLKADRGLCPSCRSYWDLVALRERYQYDGSYPKARGHHDPAVGELKVRTLARYLEVAGILLEGLDVCEVGFGGGHCLAFMAKQARNAAGIESVQANLDHAVSLGLRGEFLYHPDSLPRLLPFAIDLWIFLDSFEHIEDPSSFLAWLTANSGSQAKVLIVAPDGGSPSARLMGRHWPHRLPDHAFHWTRRGLTDVFERHGFRLVRSFFPRKYTSLGMILSHVGLMVSGRRQEDSKWGKSLGKLAFRLNLGEMGLVLQRRCV